jgi:streptogramin lyase
VVRAGVRGGDAAPARAGRRRLPVRLPVSDFGADALVAFDPGTETFRTHPSPTPGAEIRQILGRPGEVWGAGSGTDTILVLRTR